MDFEGGQARRVGGSAATIYFQSIPRCHSGRAFGTGKTPSERSQVARQGDLESQVYLCGSRRRSLFPLPAHTYTLLSRLAWRADRPSTSCSVLARPVAGCEWGRWTVLGVKLGMPAL